MTTQITQDFEEKLGLFQKEHIKLTKNAKGDYQWEIKILDLDVDKLDKINKELERGFGKNDTRNT